MAVPWKHVPSHVDARRDKPGRTQSWFALSKMSELTGRPVNWCYTNRISPGAVAGSHSHQEHEVVVVVLSGIFEVVLRDLATGVGERFIARPESSLFTIPKNVYHEVRNIGDVDGIILVFSNTRPRDESDTTYEQNA